MLSACQASAGRCHVTARTRVGATATAAPAAPAAPLRSFTPQKSWETVFHHQIGADSWKGYAGYWYIGTADGVPVDTTAMRNVRLWRCSDHEDTSRMLQRNIYERAPSFAASARREHDGYAEFTYRRDYRVPSFQPTARDVDGMPGWADRRTIGLSVDVHASVKPQVPLRLISPEEFPPPIPESESRPEVWGFELFLVDGECKWSGFAGWSVQTGQRIATALIQEYFVEVGSTDTKLDMDSMPLQPPRPALGTDLAAWLPVSSGRGVEHSSYGMQVNADSGAFEALAPSMPSQAAWPPPDTSRALEEGADLVLLPDAMYMVVPRSLPSGPGKQAMRCEFGGVMRSAGGSQLRRIVVDYSAETGLLSTLLHDTFSTAL